MNHIALLFLHLRLRFCLPVTVVDDSVGLMGVRLGPQTLQEPEDNTGAYKTALFVFAVVTQATRNWE